MLTKDDAVTLLLASGQVVLSPGQMPPPAACEAVELFGRLPLCVCIAGEEPTSNPKPHRSPRFPIV